MHSPKMKSLIGIIVLTIFIGFGAEIFAQGFIIPRPHPPHRLPLPKLTEHKVDVNIIDQAAKVEVTQVFYNDSKRAIEGNYYFPLPKEASVSDFKMYADGKVLSGELLDKKEARKIYEDIVRRNIDPALLEYVDHNLFSAKIFPIPPNKERKIILEYSTLLKLDGDLVQFTYPLRGRFESERFFAGHGRPFPGPPYVIPLDNDEDNERRPPKKKEFSADISQVITIDIKSKIPLKNIYSPSHEVDISQKEDHRAKISYEGKRRETADNFLLYYSFSRSDFGINLLTYRPDKSENGFFMLLVSPKTEFSKEEIIEKDIVFILDVSGSMFGEKIEQAKEALKYCINHLDKKDRFNIIPFSTESRPFKNNPVDASEYRKDALDYIEKIEAKGGTNINDALLEALQMEYKQNRPLSIVFMTDGLPTVGQTDIGKIINNVLSENKNKIKVFTFGVGYDVNTVLLDKIASTNFAVSDYIEPNEEIEQKISAFYDKISHPVLTDLSLDFESIQVENVFPKKLPDLFKGSQLTIMGRYGTERKEEISLSGKAKDKEKKFVYDADFSSPNDNNDFIPYLWATRKIGYLMDEIRLHGENEELKDEIVRLSKKYGVMSPYTSFLIQEDSPVAHQMMRVTPRLMKNGVNIADTESSYSENEKISFMAAMPTAKQATGSGKYAVKMSKTSREMKEAVSLSNNQYIKRIGTRTFYFKDDFWMDSEYKDEITIDIKYSSRAYMDLVLKYPDLAKFLTLGKNIIVKFKGKFLKISDKGTEKLSEKELNSLFK